MSTILHPQDTHSPFATPPNTLYPTQLSPPHSAHRAHLCSTDMKPWAAPSSSSQPGSTQRKSL